MDLQRVLGRALAKSPDDRYPSAGDLGRAALAAAEGRSVTEAERSVARGAAAPRVATRRRPAPDPEQAPPVKRYRSNRRRVYAWLGALVAAGAAAIGFVALAPGDTVVPPGGPVSTSEVERLANSFAQAYASEDQARMARLLTSDAQRVTASDRQRGRTAVVAEYKRQFAGNRTTGFRLAGLKADGGRTGRATARYTATYAGSAPSTGTMTWVVIRDRDRARIVLIKMQPS
jgi:serine/threonine-protein kinase